MYSSKFFINPPEIKRTTARELGRNYALITLR